MSFLKRISLLAERKEEPARQEAQPPNLDPQTQGRLQKISSASEPRHKPQIKPQPQQPAQSQTQTVRSTQEPLQPGPQPQLETSPGAEAQVQPPTPSRVQPGTPTPYELRSRSQSRPGMEIPRLTGYSAAKPGFLKTIWAMHPNRTTRRLRKLLLSWERLGAYVSLAGAHQELTAAAETAFLRTKISVARSVGYLKLIEGTGNLGREAAQRETEFVELLEKFPSLHSAMSASEAAKRELYYKWHSLYLFLHNVLGANPYEISREASDVRFGRHTGRGGATVTPPKVASITGKKTG